MLAGLLPGFLWVHNTGLLWDTDGLTRSKLKRLG
jgi:hypothetical protein